MATPPLQRGRKKYFTPLQKNDEEGANRPQFELTFSNFDYTTKSAAAQQKSPVDIGGKRNYNKDREKVSRERFAPSFIRQEVAVNFGAWAATSCYVAGPE